jgi:hypothetical protein
MMNANDEQTIQVLESEWAPETGFFWRVRQGVFDPNEFQRALATLRTFSFTDDAPLPGRVVSLIWFIPIFMVWQVDRVRDAGGDLPAYTEAVTLMTNEVQRLLGVP